VPQRAVTFDASGEATAFFVENGKAVSHVLTTAGTSGNNWVVTAGVADGAQLVVDGLQKISNGSAVAPVPVALNDQGVAVDTNGSASSSAVPNGGPPAAAPANGAASSRQSSAVAPTSTASAAPSSPPVSPAPASGVSGSAVEAPAAGASTP